MTKYISVWDNLSAGGWWTHGTARNTGMVKEKREQDRKKWFDDRIFFHRRSMSSRPSSNNLTWRNTLSHQLIKNPDKILLCFWTEICFPDHDHYFSVLFQNHQTDHRHCSTSIFQSLSSSPQMTKQEMNRDIYSIKHSLQNEVRPSTHTAHVHAVIWHISTWPGCSRTFTGHDLSGEGQSSHQRWYQSAKVKRKDKEHTPGLSRIDHSHDDVVKIQPSTRQHIRQAQPF